MRTRLILTLLVFLVVAPGAGAAPLPNGKISDEKTTTYWGYAIERTAVRAAPNSHARRIDSLHLWTEVGFSEIYPVLATHTTGRTTWYKVRLAGRPNGRTGWIVSGALNRLSVVHTHLVLDVSALRLTLYRWGRKIFSAPVGIGKPSTPTPRGNFWITEKFRAQGGAYGPFAFGTSDYSVLSDWAGGGVIGIHGTDEPQLIPGRPSHGCIRLRNGDVTRLWRLLAVGTPLTIR